MEIYIAIGIYLIAQTAFFIWAYHYQKRDVSLADIFVIIFICSWAWPLIVLWFLGINAQKIIIWEGKNHENNPPTI